MDDVGAGVAVVVDAIGTTVVVADVSAIEVPAVDVELATFVFCPLRYFFSFLLNFKVSGLILVPVAFLVQNSSVGLNLHSILSFQFSKSSIFL